LSLSARSAAFCFCCVLLFGTAASAEEVKIYLKTSPAKEYLQPFADPVNISLLITHADGRPVEQGSVGIILDAPKPGVFWSTDFPVVENSRLLELFLPLRQGRTGWKYLFPIRGDYRLSVSVVAADGTRTSKNFVIPVHENRNKWLSLGLFCAGLFVVGFAAGRIFTVIPAAMKIAWLLLIFAGVGVASGHDGPASIDTNAIPATSLDIAAATVGNPTSLHWRAPTGAATPALLSLTIVHLEKHKTVFAIDKVPVDREYRLNFNFPDGAEYRVNSIAEIPGREPVRTEQLVAVSAVEPPVIAQVPALVFFLVIVALGLGAGRLSKTLVIR
jgi:hypothetical protein